MIRYFILIIVFFSGCSSVKQEAPKGNLFVSILMTEGAHEGKVLGKEGFEFYIEQSPPNTLGPFLKGYRYKNGKVIEYFSLGSASRNFVKEIETIEFKPFDYELEKVKAEEAARKDYPIISAVKDGAKWELKIITSEGEFYLHEWNPRVEIEVLAPYCKNFKKLDTLIKVLSRYYGSYHLHM